jgi:hypothetical protein
LQRDHLLRYLKPVFNACKLLQIFQVRLLRDLLAAPQVEYLDESPLIHILYVQLLLQALSEASAISEPAGAYLYVSEGRYRQIPSV